MPSWAIHLRVAQKLLSKMTIKDSRSFILGNILPDVNVGHLIQPISKQISYTDTHYGRIQTFEGKTRKLPDYNQFIKEHIDIIKEPMILGYICHLITDFYWNYHTYIKKGIYQDGELTGLKGKKNTIIGDSEFIRKIKVNDFNTFSCYLYINQLVTIPKFEKDLIDETRKIKCIHIEEQDLEGINKYFEEIIETVKDMNLDFKIYDLQEMEESLEENINLIEKILKKLE